MRLQVLMKAADKSSVKSLTRRFLPPPSCDKLLRLSWSGGRDLIALSEEQREVNNSRSQFMIRSKRLLSWSVLILSAAVANAAPTSIVNGGFETGNFSGWTLSGNTAGMGVCATGSNYLGSICSSQSGTYAAALGPFGSPGFLSQTIATTPGEEYTLMFFMRVDNLGQAANNDFSMSWDGTTLYAVTNAGDSGYLPLVFYGLTASTSSTTLEFSLRNNPGGFFLDEISASTVPEPGTVLLAFVGLSLLAGLRKRVR